MVLSYPATIEFPWLISMPAEGATAIDPKRSERPTCRPDHRSNPEQCRGQIDGAIAMGIGWALTENMIHDAEGRVLNPALRDYRIPAFADIPRSQVFFADTCDKIGPLGGRKHRASARSIRWLRL
jgi:hypothetical protein